MAALNKTAAGQRHADEQQEQAVKQGGKTKRRGDCNRCRAAESSARALGVAASLVLQGGGEGEGPTNLNL